MFKRGLPSDIKMRHDTHYVEDLAKTTRSVGKIIPISHLEPNPEQPRSEIGDLSELASSVKEKGVLEPILVKPCGQDKWMIIAGERRWRAANLAGLKEVPCIELDLDEKSIAEIALIENLQRKDLTIWEEADGLAFLAERFNYTHQEIAQKIGKSRTTVTESLAIAGIPQDIREKCRSANVSSKASLLEIARQFDEKAMHEFVDSINGSKHKILKKQKPSEKSNGNSSEKFSGFANKKENSFLYVAKDKSFSLEIKFTNASGYEKKDILKALKQAFENVKTENQND